MSSSIIYTLARIIKQNQVYADQSTLRVITQKLLLKSDWKLKLV